MIIDFVAIDFEISNQHPCSVCSVGIVIVKDGEAVDPYYSLIHPDPDYYSYICQRVHGLSKRETYDAPSFPEVWNGVMSRISEVFSEIEYIPFVAHNARFDEGCLKAVFRTYQMEYPDYHFYDTLAAARRQFGHSLPNHQLHTVAAACGYDLTRHHHALADAEACAAISLCLL